MRGVSASTPIIRATEQQLSSLYDCYIPNCLYYKHTHGYWSAGPPHHFNLRGSRNVCVCVCVSMAVQISVTLNDIFNKTCKSFLRYLQHRRFPSRLLFKPANAFEPSDSFDTSMPVNGFSFERLKEIRRKKTPSFCVCVYITGCAACVNLH